MYDYKIKIAGITVRIIGRNGYLFNLCKDYITSGTEHFTVSVSDDDISREADFCLKTNGFVLDEYLLESTAVYRKICAKLIKYDAFLIHSAVVGINGRAIAFLGKSGAGKTTQSGYWVSELGAEYINGDKPIIRLIDGRFYVFGTPWSGKEQYNKNTFAPLSAFVNVNKADFNEIKLIKSYDAVPLVLKRIYYSDSQSLEKIMDMLDGILKDVPVFDLFCKKEPQSAVVAYNGIKSYLEGNL